MSTLRVGETDHEIFSVAGTPGVERLPYSLRILLENALRSGSESGVDAVTSWAPDAEPSRELAFVPARVLLQDFTGVPALVDLAAMRDAMAELGGDPASIDPVLPSELVIDHSVQVDEFGSRFAIERNVELEYERNRERYAFLRWGQGSFENLEVVPPNTGICHQVNLEYLARVVEDREVDGWRQAFPDTLIGTDSHTTMVNGLGVLGWGVGGIEAEAAMLGEPVSLLVPQVIGVRMNGDLPETATATDLVLTVTETLRRLGVVGKFVEFFGRGLRSLTVADRATIANMSPEYGATCGFFPVDEQTVDYLRLTGRPEARVALVEAYCRENMLWHDPEHQPEYSELVELDLSRVEPSLAGPRRPQDRVALSSAKESFNTEFERGNGSREASVPVELDGDGFGLESGSVVIAAITSCTNTSNPQVMLAAGLLARNAVERGLNRKPWVKSSLAPGSRVVTKYFEQAGLQQHLDELGFQTVGYGCTTCIGNSGPLAEPISKAIAAGDLVVSSVLSGNRNFEARIHPEVKANYLASPPLVVAYALAGRIDVDLTTEPLGRGKNGEDVFLSEIWPSREEVQGLIGEFVRSELFRDEYTDVYTGDERWRALPVPSGSRFAWNPGSTYIRRPPYFEELPAEPKPVADVEGARCLVVLGDSVTTDHISPAGAIRPDDPAGRYLLEHGIARPDFNSYGSRRGNHEVMVRGTFANVRLKNLLVPGSEGTWTARFPGGEEMSIFDAAERYRTDGVPLVVLAGAEYGSGSSRDWAAKGPALLGVRAVIAESYERIHRSNLLMMGVLPLQFADGENRESLGLTGREEFSITGLDGVAADDVVVRADEIEFRARVRLDTPREREYFRHGGILPFVLRRLAGTG